MTIYKIVFEGVFKVPKTERRKRNLPAGFFTTRFFDAPSVESAIEQAEMSIRDELAQQIDRNSSHDVELVVTSCSEYESWPDIATNRGFSFYLQ